MIVTEGSRTDIDSCHFQIAGVGVGNLLSAHALKNVLLILAVDVQHPIDVRWPLRTLQFVLHVA
jgi:hypothetical protein